VRKYLVCNFAFIHVCALLASLWRINNHINDVPDLLVTVNFTALNITSDVSHLYTMRLSTVYIFVGLTNNAEDIITNTQPISLTRGLQLYGRIGTEIRQKYAKPSTSSVGILTVSDSILQPCFSADEYNTYRISFN
jgi:hypothetical protein